jgi:hypothetical protein
MVQERTEDVEMATESHCKGGGPVKGALQKAFGKIKGVGSLCLEKCAAPKLETRAEDWPWSGLWRRMQGTCN